METKTGISIIIPVREGSTRIKNKVTLPFGDNLNLLEWKIDQLLLVHPKNRIIVSSNSENLKSIALNMGVLFHQRDDFLSIGHNATFSEVIVGIVKEIETEHFAWITVVVPLMSPNEYLKGFKLYREAVIDKKRFDSLVAVNLLKEYLWEESQPLNYCADKNHTISQELPNIYRVTNGLYMSSKSRTLESGYFLGENPYKYIVSKISGIDIDEYEDYELAKHLIPLYKKTILKIGGNKAHKS